MKPLLSIGMIFKNDIRCLERCMKSLEPLRKAIPCELVMADTGSTDGSREIAQKYADILFDFHWVDDFSAARNAVMDRCSGNCYLTIDTDEWLDPDFTELIDFVKKDSYQKYDIGFLLQRNFLDTEDKSLYCDVSAQRVLRMSTGLRYVGAIHEIWNNTERHLCFMMVKTVLWHDGYVGTLYKDAAEKSKRNLPLIESEFKAHPENGIRLQQAMDAAYTPALIFKYTHLTMDWLHSDKNQNSQLSSILYRSCVHHAAKNNFPELNSWIHEAMEHHKDSIYIRADVAWLAARTAYSQKEWENCIRYGEMYLKQMAQIDTYPIRERCQLTAGPLIYEHSSARQQMRLMLAETFANLMKWDLCRKYLCWEPAEQLITENLEYWLHIAFRVWEHVELKAAFSQLGKSLSQLEGKPGDAKRKALKRKCRELLSRGIAEEPSVDSDIFPAPALPLLLELGDCDQSFGAKILLSNNVEKIQSYAEQIENWKDIPAAVVFQLIEHQMELPDKFYLQSASQLENLAAELIQMMEPETRLKLLEQFPQAPGKKQLWVYNLAIGAVSASKWSNQEDENLLLQWNRYAHCTTIFLQERYQQTLLTEELIDLLPDMYSYGWYCAQAWNSRDAVTFISWLRKGLQAAPRMKKMITFLMEHAEDPRVRKPSPELQALADQVKAILASYPENDPTVSEIKQLPVYQQVKYLIENT